MQAPAPKPHRLQPDQFQAVRLGELGEFLTGEAFGLSSDGECGLAGVSRRRTALQALSSPIIRRLGLIPQTMEPLGRHTLLSSAKAEPARSK
jgi:hypothetical protein